MARTRNREESKNDYPNGQDQDKKENNLKKGEEKQKKKQRPNLKMARPRNHEESKNDYSKIPSLKMARKKKKNNKAESVTCKLVCNLN